MVVGVSSCVAWLTPFRMGGCGSGAAWPERGVMGHAGTTVVRWPPRHSPQCVYVGGGGQTSHPFCHSGPPPWPGCGRTSHGSARSRASRTPQSAARRCPPALRKAMRRNRGTSLGTLCTSPWSWRTRGCDCTRRGRRPWAGMHHVAATARARGRTRRSAANASGQPCWFGLGTGFFFVRWAVAAHSGNLVPCELVARYRGSTK